MSHKFGTETILAPSVMSEPTKPCNSNSEIHLYNVHVHSLDAYTESFVKLSNLRPGFQGLQCNSQGSWQVVDGTYICNIYIYYYYVLIYCKLFTRARTSQGGSSGLWWI